MYQCKHNHQQVKEEWSVLQTKKCQSSWHAELRSPATQWQWQWFTCLKNALIVRCLSCLKGWYLLRLTTRYQRIQAGEELFWQLCTSYFSGNITEKCCQKNSYSSASQVEFGHSFPFIQNQPSNIPKCCLTCGFRKMMPLILLSKSDCFCCAGAGRLVCLLPFWPFEGTSCVGWGGGLASTWHKNVNLPAPYLADWRIYQT